MSLHSVRLWVTEGCNASCHFCMNKNRRSNKTIDISKLERTYSYLRENEVNSVFLMGGEPTIHTDFVKIYTISQLYFDKVILFTNGLRTDVLTEIEPRVSDTIVYNANFVNDISTQVLLLEKEGLRIFDVVIDDLTDVISIANGLRKIAENDKRRLKFQITINNSVNIFEKREIISKNINVLYGLLKNDYLDVSFECAAPICFTYGLKLPIFKQRTICPNESMLIDSEYNVCFCNVRNTPLVNLYQDGELVSFQIIKNYIHLCSYKNKTKCLEKICKDCIYYDLKCNGKCHIAQDCITVESIRDNTELPWLKRTR